MGIKCYGTKITPLGIDGEPHSSVHNPHQLSEHLIRAIVQPRFTSPPPLACTYIKQSTVNQVSMQD